MRIVAAPKHPTPGVKKLKFMMFTSTFINVHVYMHTLHYVFKKRCGISAIISASAPEVELQKT